MRITFFIACLLLAACQPHSKYMIVEPNKNLRHPAFKFYYSNKIIKKDSCLVFITLDNDTCRVCGGYLVSNE